MGLRERSRRGRSDAAAFLAAAGQREYARGLVDEEPTTAERIGAARPLGLALRAAALAGDSRARLRLLRDAAEQLRRARPPIELARTLTDLGVAELRAGERDADRAHGELLVAGAQPGRPRFSGRDALTPGELRVAQLAAAGRTNREIAAELFLTPKTIETHLGHTYSKLAIAGRRELADALGDPFD